MNRIYQKILFLVILLGLQQLWAAAPDAPTGLAASATGDGEVTLSWTVGGNGGSAITKHQVRYKKGTAAYNEWEDISDSAAGEDNEDGHVVTGLEYAEYTFDIRAVNADGDGAKVSKTFTAQTRPDDFNSCNSPNRVTISDYPWLRVFIVCIINAASAGGSPLTGYESRVKPSGESWGDWQPHELYGFGFQHWIQFPLTPGTYTIEVRPVNIHGAGNAGVNGTFGNFTLAAEIPGGLIGGPNATLVSGRDVQLSWGAPHNEGDRITHMEYSYKKEGESYGSWIPIPNSRQGIPPEENQDNFESYTITGLEGGRYKFKVRGVNSIGNGDISESRNYIAVPTELPATPINLQAQGANESVQLTWQAGTVNGPAITKHQYQMKEGAGSYGAWEDISNSAVGESNDSVYTVTGLTNGTAYSFKLRSKNIDGFSGETSEVTATPQSTSVPGIPVLTKAMASKDSTTWSVLLEWDAADDNGNAITGYQYKMKTDSGSYGAWVPIAQSGEGGTNESSFTITGLSEGHAYSFRLQAINGNGAGGESNEKTAIAVVPPAVSSATVSSSWLEITFNKNLDTTSKPSGTDFTVNADSSLHAVSGVHIEGQKLMLELSSPVEPSETVTFDYTVGTRPLKESLGLAHAESFTGESAINESLQIRWEDSADIRAVEGESASLCVLLSKTVNREVQLKASRTNPTVANNWAEGIDYSNLPQTVTIPPQQSRHCFTVGLVDDTRDETEETFLVYVEAKGERVTIGGASVVKKVNSFEGGTRQIFITDNDGPPSITTPGPFSVDENTLAVTQLSAMAEPGGGVITWTITGGADETLFALTSGGILSFTAPKDFENPASDDGDNTFELTVRAYDGAYGVEATIEIQVQNVNEPPVIETLGPFGMDEGEVEVATLEATKETGETLSWSIIGGEDSAHFSLTTEVDHTGTLVFGSAKDFASPDDVGADRVYRVKVQVSDGTHDVPADLLIQLHEVSGGVADVQVPVIDTLGPFTVAENETEVATLRATDAQGDTLTWSLVEDGDADHFTITTDNTTYAGTLVFNEAKDFETPDDEGKNRIYQLIVKVSDGNNEARTHLVIQLQDVNEAPEILTPEILQVVPDGATSVQLSATIDAGESLTWALIGGVDESHFSLTNNGELSLNEPKDLEIFDDSDGDGIYQITVQVSDGTHTSNADIHIELKEKASPLSGDSSGGGGCATIKLLGDQDTPLAGGRSHAGQAAFFLALMLLPVILTQRWKYLRW